MRTTRRWWVALLLGLIATGLGQVYNGQWKKGLLFYVLLLATIPGLFALMAALPVRPFNIVGPIAAFLALVLLVLIDAVRTARRSRLFRPDYDRWYFYALIVLAQFLLLQGYVKAYRRIGMQTFQVLSGGMSNAILVGDHVLVDRTVFGASLFGREIWKAAPPRRSEIVVFEYPPNSEKMFLQRILGLPGETIEIHDYHVSVDGHVLEEPYVKFDAFSYTPAYKDFGPMRIPSAHVFLLGDRRDDSFDSRFRGPIPLAGLRGRPIRVYWSLDPIGKRPRWDRIGTSIR